MTPKRELPPGIRAALAAARVALENAKQKPVQKKSGR